MGSAVTKALTGNNLMDFVTGRGGSNPGLFRPGADGGQNISLPELLGFQTVGGQSTWTGNILGQGHFGNAENRFNYMSAMKHNFGRNGVQSIGTLVLTPIAFKMGRKLARKPISMANKLLKGSGIRV